MVQRENVCAKKEVKIIYGHVSKEHKMLVAQISSVRIVGQCKQNNSWIILEPLWVLGPVPEVTGDGRSIDKKSPWGKASAQINAMHGGLGKYIRHIKKCYYGVPRRRRTVTDMVGTEDQIRQSPWRSLFYSRSLFTFYLLQWHDCGRWPMNIDSLIDTQ